MHPTIGPLASIDSGCLRFASGHPLGRPRPRGITLEGEAALAWLSPGPGDVRRDDGAYLPRRVQTTGVAIPYVRRRGAVEMAVDSVQPVDVDDNANAERIGFAVGMRAAPMLMPGAVLRHPPRVIRTGEMQDRRRGRQAP